MVADNLEAEALGQSNAVSGPGVQTGLSIEHHVVVGVGGVPLSAEYVLGTYNGVNHLYGRLLAAADLGSNAVDLAGLGVEGDHEVIGASLGDVHDPVVVHALGPLVSPGVVADNLEAEALGQGNAVSGPGVQAGLSIEHHVVVGIGGVPLSAEYVLGTYYGVNHLYGRLLAALLGSNAGDPLGLGIEGDHDVISAILGAGVDPVVVTFLVALGPAGVPVAVGNNLELELIASGHLNIVLGPGVEAVSQGHEVCFVVCVPIRTEHVLRTSNDVVGFKLLDRSERAGCFAGLGVEGDGDVVDAIARNFLGEVVAHALRPLKAPVVVAHNFVRERAFAQSDILQSDGVNTVLEGHVADGVLLVPVVEIADCAVNGDHGRCNITVNHELGVFLVKGEDVFTVTIELVSIASPVLRGCNPLTRIRGVAVVCGAETVVKQCIPVTGILGLAIKEVEINGLTVQGSHNRVCAVTIVSHFLGIIGAPATHRAVTNNVHLRVSVQANEHNH